MHARRRRRWTEEKMQESQSLERDMLDGGFRCSAFCGSAGTSHVRAQSGAWAVGERRFLLVPHAFILQLNHGAMVITLRHARNQRPHPIDSHRMHGIDISQSPKTNISLRAAVRACGTAGVSHGASGWSSQTQVPINAASSLSRL